MARVPQKRSRPRLIYADSERSADLLYAVTLFIPDPLLWAEVDGRRLLVASALEYGRLKMQAPPGLEVLSHADVRKNFGVRKPTPANLIAGLSRHFGYKQWDVPAEFPIALAQKLRRRRVTVHPVDGAFFPEREIKSPQEAEAVRRGVELAEAGLLVGLDILRAAAIKGDYLQWQGAPLTAEILRGEIDAEISRLGGLASHTIVAPGRQGADPHNCGSGIIRPHQPIVLDIFPRVMASGYHGDLTRTVVKGKAAKIVKQAYSAVLAAQTAAIDAIKPGVLGRSIHQLVKDVLCEHGFETDAAADPPYGFFHSTGHGLGLEVHETPGLGSTGTRHLRRGHLVTIEPGLYYTEWGGVRLEDVVWLQKGGCQNLTIVEKTLEIS